MAFTGFFKLLWGTGPSGISVCPLVFLCTGMVLEMDSSILWLIMKCLSFWIAWRALALTTGKSVSASHLYTAEKETLGYKMRLWMKTWLSSHPYWFSPEFRKLLFLLLFTWFQILEYNSRILSACTTYTCVRIHFLGILDGYDNLFCAIGWL